MRAAFLLAAIAFGCAMPVRAAGVTRTSFGTLSDGRTVDAYRLSNDAGMTATVLTLGGIITELRVPDARGRIDTVVLALPDLAAYLVRPNFSSIVGRYANRISGGGFTLDGVRYALPAGADGIISHGGRGGFGARLWRAQVVTDGVRLTLVSPDGENGFPGTLNVSATFTLARANTLRIAYSATTDRSTVLNLTHHAYFNLAGAASGQIDAQRLQILAVRYTPVDARRVPTGEIARVAGTPFDLRRPARIGDRVTADHPQLRLARGFDHNFVIDGRPGTLRVAARADDPGTGRTLEVATTEPGLQLYTANGFDGTLAGAGGRMLQARDGYALETQHFADSPNRPNFPSIVLRPGATFRSITEYRFGVRR